MSQQTVILREHEEGPGCIVQTLWFLVIGWWLSQLALLVGYLLLFTVIGIPLGFRLLNRVPYLATLRRFSKQMRAVTGKHGELIVEHGDLDQRSILTRFLWFVVFGWWLGLITLELAWLLTASVLFAPAGLWLFAKSPAVLTLRR